MVSLKEPCMDALPEVDYEAMLNAVPEKVDPTTGKFSVSKSVMLDFKRILMYTTTQYSKCNGNEVKP